MLPSPEETLELTVAGLSALLTAAATPIRLVDCREEDEFAICKIPGAILTPLSKFPDSALPLLEDPDAPPVVVYCHHGMRSQHAALFLRDRGVKNAFSLAGGIDAWSQQVDPAVPRY